VAKPNKADKADRRAVVEQMRREQKSKERRQSMMVLGAAVTVGAVIIGIAVWQFMKADGSSANQLAGLGVASSEAGCQEVVAREAEGSNDHRADGEKILYPQAPPAFGPHWGTYLQGPQIRKLYTVDDRPPVEQLVHSLEHGHTILWYDETIAEDDAAMEELEAIARKFPSNTDFNDKFIAAPWTSEDGEAFPDKTHVALTHWSMGGTNGNPDGQQGVWQYCKDVSGEVVEEFMGDYPYTDSPEPNAP
jgi:Protein of unknown function (DUF3105)